MAMSLLRPAASRLSKQLQRPGTSGRAMVLAVRGFKADSPKEAKAQNSPETQVARQTDQKAVAPRRQQALDALPYRRMTDALAQMQREMDALMMAPFGLLDSLMTPDIGSFFAPSRGAMGALSRVVPIEVQEDEKSYTISAEVPGFTKEDVKVTLDPASNMLTISGHKSAKEEKDKEGAAMTRSSMSFTRSFTLPQDVDTEKEISAKTEHGVLTITLPKSQGAPAPNVRTINVE